MVFSAECSLAHPLLASRFPMMQVLSAAWFTPCPRLTLSIGCFIPAASCSGAKGADDI